jgi:hypothetical protein
MTGREKDLDRALAGFSSTGDEEIDGLAETAERLAGHFTVPAPAQSQGRSLFIEGVAARHRSIMSSLALPGLAVFALLLVIALVGRTALPGDQLYPVRKVLRSAHLASSPFGELEQQLDEAELLLAKARTQFDRGSDEAEGYAVACLMRLGRAESYLSDLSGSERIQFETTLDRLKQQAVVLIRLDAVTPTVDDHGGARDGSGGDDSSGSDDSGSSNSGSGSDDSGGDSSGPGSGSDDSSGSGSGSDDSNSGPGSDG